MNKPDLLRYRWCALLLRARVPQLALVTLALAGFVGVIAAGLRGTPVGARNPAIVFVWIGWWAFLMLLALPFGGRLWCSLCPVPAPGEWLQRGAVLGPQRGRPVGLRWPRQLRGMWLQNAGFLLVAIFSTVILTVPAISAAVLLFFMAVATVVALVFERRTFCRYLCPVGGFIGVYSELAPIELRVRDAAVCAAHTTKACYTGSEAGYGCPWNVFPPGLTRNVNCGLCLECLRTCPHDNIGITVRWPGAGLRARTSPGLDEAFKACLMLASAVAYAAVMLGPWGALKMAAFDVGSTRWAAYAGGYLLLVGGVMPGLLWTAALGGRRLARSSIPMRPLVTSFARALVPLGLAAWIAFTVAFAFANLSYLWPALSDPLARGWDLFGTADVAWTPYLTRLAPGLQACIVLGGLAWSSLEIRRAADRLTLPSAAARLALPVMGYGLVVSVALLRLLVA